MEIASLHLAFESYGGSVQEISQGTGKESVALVV